MTNDYMTLLADLEEEKVIDLTRKRLEAGEDPMKILEDSRKGMEIVGQRFASDEYFLPELVYSGEILKHITEIVKPHIKQNVEQKRLGKVVIGTVSGDIHDIGLNIVEFMLDVNGFEVYNLGVDVPVQSFIDKVKETGAPVLGLSGFLTPAFDVMKEVVEAVTKANLRDKIKIMIGGGQMNNDIKDYVKADAYGKNAMAAVELARNWITSGAAA